jgi:hypothetical protein
VKRQILALLPLAALVLAACGTGSSGTLTLTSSSSATGTSGTPRAFAATATSKPARTPLVPTSTKAATATKVAKTTTTAPTNAPANIAAPAGAHTWYTSSAGNAKYYYCDLDDGWKTLSAKNLRSYSSESALLAEFPARSKYPSSKC